MNLADPELELIDPTPNVHALFLQFDKVFFWTKLASRAVVRWSKRMYSCAGICSYEGRGGLCDIALSEPLLKLRPRKDLIETLLHEMIHAFLFITCRDQDRDGHGPNFKEHMYRINKAAGINISIYHDFHDEVKLYQTHWWRCNGPCQTRKPYFGIVRRTQNRAPGPNDCWWSCHQKTCGGTFLKIKEPEKKTKKAAAEKKKNVGDITKYVKSKTANTKTVNTNTGEVRKPLTPIVKKATGAVGGKVKSNGGNTLVVTQKNATNSPVSKPPSSQPILVFSGKGQLVSGERKRTNSVDVAETVRNIWADKKLPGLTNNKNVSSKRKSTSSVSDNLKSSVTKLNTSTEKHETESPPTKIIKIVDYFKTSTTATTILKDLYGMDFTLTQSSNKIVAKKVDLVDCPICNAKIDNNEINRHIDECLNKDVIEKLSKDNIETLEPASTNNVSNIKDTKEKSPTISQHINHNGNDFVRMFKVENDDVKPILTHPNSNKDIKLDKGVRKSDNFVVVNGVSTTEVFKTPAIKAEPGTSKDSAAISQQICLCCGTKITKSMAEHLDECLSFFDNNTTMPEEGASTSFANNTIVIDDDDDDDMMDETLTLNATGTKTPCPCCLEMIEMADMNAHLDSCLN